MAAIEQVNNNYYYYVICIATTNIKDAACNLIGLIISGDNLATNTPIDVKIELITYLSSA